MSLKKITLYSGIFIIAISLIFLNPHNAQAAPVVNFPVTVTQPDGSKLDLFASGDEYYNWLQDAQGFTVLQDPVSGYYVYADLVSGSLVPTPYIASRVNPASAGLRPHLNISPEKMGTIRQAFLNQTKQTEGQTVNAPTSGTITNLVVFIRFNGESEFSNPLSTYTNMLNSSTAGANSLRNYFLEASYNALTVNSALFPTPGAAVVSYQDSHSRGYFQPYSVTNTLGYTGGDNGTMRREREHGLLRDAIAYVNGLGQFPGGTTIDGDGDGYVDSLTFIVSGSPTGWASLLWPHAWSLYTYTVTISGKNVGGYNFQLDSMLNNGVLAHEMFHVLGAPDLYHYTSNGISPVGGWDVMENNANPPEHMGCYMKYKYGHWISSIPEISAAGTYTLNPLTSSTNNCFKKASPYSSTEFFVMEYRNGAGSTFESSLPGTGLLVYRINTLVTGNADGPPDEVYVYRPGGTTTVNGSVNTANFSSNVGRTAINDLTNPSSFLSNGAAGGLSLCNIGASNATISFDICTTIPYSISGYVRTSGGAGISGVTMSGLPLNPTTDASGYYSGTVNQGWSGTVTPQKFGYAFTPTSINYSSVSSNQSNQNYTGQLSGATILLVDDDDNNPDVRSYYSDTLTALGKIFDVWDTNNSDNEPSAADLAPYDEVIWFTGAEYGGSAGPGTAGTTALGSWLDGGGCFLLSSQDYYWDRGLTTFTTTYLGVSTVTSDVEQVTVTGAGSVFSGLGPFSLSYPFANFSDLITPNATAESAFSGDKGSAAVDKDSGVYRTTYFGYPFEALPSTTARQQVMNAFLTWCSLPQAPSGVSASDGTYTDKVQISWSASSGATYYQVYRNTSNTSSGASLLGSPSASPFDDRSATPGTTNWYFVKACNTAGCSGFSISDSGYRNPGNQTLTVSKVGTGSGSVSSNPAGISCGSTCSYAFTYNTVVTLTASPTAPSTFVGWSGEGCSGTGTCNVTMSAARSVTATFDYPNQTLTVSKVGTGSGSVSSNPAGISCGSTCSYAFTYNTVVTLTASPTAPSTFVGWSGEGCSGTGTCNVTMSAARSVTATFDYPNQTLTVSKVGTGSGTVSSNPAGISCGSTCSYAFTYNTVVTLTASPTAPSTFVGWSGEGCSGTGTCNVTMSAARSVTATFDYPNQTLTVSKVGTGSGSVSSNPAGISCGSTCSYAFTYNTVVTLTASPTAPSTFVGWSGEGCSGTGTCNVTMSAARSVTATFDYPNQTLTVSKVGTGSGSVSSNPAGISCGSTCSYAFTYNTVVTLTASPTAPSTFVGWSGEGCSGTGTCNVTMSAARSVTATFDYPNQTLTVSKVGTGSGSVSSNPAGISCGSTCSYAFTYNTVVTLTASPTAPSTFVGWSGEGCSGTGTCNVTMSAARSVTATFDYPNQTLTVSKVGTGSGTVSSNPAGISCGSTCSYAFTYNTVVTLTASPTAPSTFVGWSGEGCSGTGTCNVTMSAARSVTATFDYPNQTLTVSKVGTGSGSVSSNPAGISCGSTCSYAFTYNTVVTLTASPTAPSTFVGWSGEGCSGTGTCNVTMSAARSVTATFDYPNQTLTVSKVGTGSGSVSSNPAGISCGSTCSYAFTYNTVVTLTASPTAPSTFVGWSGEGCSGTGTCNVTMSAARSVTATFDYPNQTLTVSKVGTGSGSVSSNPAGISCGSTCSYAFTYNTVVTLTASSTAPSTFVGWSGEGCSGTGTCNVTMSAAKSVSATFTPVTNPWRIFLPLVIR